jgi:hypothetical protein
MPEMVATELVLWQEWDERLRQYVKKSLKQGQTGDVPDEVVARVEALTNSDTADIYDRGRPRLLTPDDHAAWTNTNIIAADPVLSITDEQINAMTADELLAKLNQLPALAARVLELEKARKYTRKPIVAHAERLIAAAEGEDVSLADQSVAAGLIPSEA